MDLNVDLPSSVVLSKKRFEFNERFHKQRDFFNDSDFFRIHKKKMKSNQRMNADGLSAFLQGQTGVGLEMSSIDKITAEEISYCDLATLTDLDLQLFGFKYHKERESLLHFFRELPNQDPTFVQLCNQPEAKVYNATIIKNANAHLRTMQHSLIEANYKLQIDVPDDILVGDKYFASSFLIKALDEVHDATGEIENELEELSKLINLKRQRYKELGLYAKSWLLLAFVTGIAAAFSVWLMKSQQQ